MGRKLLKPAAALCAAFIALAGHAADKAPPGSPAATTTIDGKQLPPPDPKFDGVIKDNASQSKAWWAPRVVHPNRPPMFC